VREITDQTQTLQFFQRKLPSRRHKVLPGLSLLSKFIPNEAQKIQIEVHLGPKFKFGFHCAYFHEYHGHSINFPGKPMEFYPNRIKMWKTGGNLIYALCFVIWYYILKQFARTSHKQYFQNSKKNYTNYYKLRQSRYVPSSI